MDSAPLPRQGRRRFKPRRPASLALPPLLTPLGGTAELLHGDVKEHQRADAPAQAALRAGRGGSTAASGV